ncbi:MAG TPA: alpha/beta hydrolase [Anaerolineales bacterium]|nr:alpha/beta hydrolase [Anaerolineales bacterium]
MSVSQSTTVSKDGTTLAFRRSGTGEPILLVSPALRDHAGNELLGKLLSRNLTIINYDRRGRGASGDTPPYAVEREIEDIEALIDATGGAAHLFGSSSGAVLALEAANALGSKVKTLFIYEPPFIVEDSHPSVPGDYIEHLEKLIASGRRGEAVEYFLRTAMGVPDDALHQLREGPMWPSLEAAAHTLPYDARIMGTTMRGNALPAGRWRAVTAPTLIMAGANSPAWLQRAARAAAGILPRAAYRELEGLDASAITSAPLDIATTMYGFFLAEHMRNKK